MRFETWILGSGDHCQIIINAPTVSTEHCRLTRLPDGYLIEDLGSTNGVFVNGERLHRPRLVSPSDNVTLGSRVPLPWERVSRPADGTLVLRVGREPDNDIVLDAQTVSGHHAVLERREGVWRVEDLGSTNGTFLNQPGARVASTIIRSGDVLYFGSLPVPVSHLLFAESSARGSTVPMAPPAAVADRPREARVATLFVGAAVLLSGAAGVLAVGFLARQPSNQKEPARVVVDPSAVVHSPRVAKATAVEASGERAPEKIAAAPAAVSDALLENRKNGIVWLGLSAEDLTVPYATGWAARPAVVVTTGHAAATLKELADKQRMRVVAWQQGKFLNVQSVHWHPEYDPRQPGASKSLRFNVGFVVLEDAAAAICPVADGGPGTISMDAPLRALGFAQSSGAVEAFDPLKFTPRAIDARLLGCETFAADDRWILVTDLEAPKGFEGSPVFDGKGMVVGTLAPSANRTFVVPPCELDRVAKDVPNDHSKMSRPR